MAEGRVSELWGDVAARRARDPVHGWLDAPIVLDEIVGPLQTGRRGLHWLVALVEDLGIARNGRWLSLGCGSAATEIFASKEGLFDSMAALDVSPAALDIARRAAASAGASNITFRRADLNDLTLPQETFDVVLLNMALHHVTNLEGVTALLEKALKPDGVLLLNEYVGPSQFQFTDRQAALASEILVALGSPWNTDATTGKPKLLFLRMPKEHWNVVDPSEAIRSAEMLPVLQPRFEIVLRRDYGGTLLNLVLENIVGNFDPRDPKDAGAIRLLGLVESVLIRQGALPSDFTLVALRRRPHPAAVTGEDSLEKPWAVASPKEAAYLRFERAALESRLVDLEKHIQAIETSKGWKLLQLLRGLVGRKW